MTIIKTLIDVLHDNERLPAGKQYDTVKINMNEETVSALESVNAIERAVKPAPAENESKKPKKQASADK